MAEEKKICVTTDSGYVEYVYTESGNVYRVTPDPLLGMFGLKDYTKVGSASNIDDAISVAKSDAKERTGGSVRSVDIK